MPVDYNRRFEQIAQDQQRQQQRREAEPLQQQRQQAEQNARRFRQQQREREAADTTALVNRTLAQLHHHHAQSRVPNLEGWASLPFEDDDLGGLRPRSPPSNSRAPSASPLPRLGATSVAFRPGFPARTVARSRSPPPQLAAPFFRHVHGPSGGHSVHYPSDNRPPAQVGPPYPYNNQSPGGRQPYIRDSSSQYPGPGTRPGSTGSFGLRSLGKGAGGKEGGYRRAMIYGS